MHRQEWSYGAIEKGEDFPFYEEIVKQKLKCI